MSKPNKFLGNVLKKAKIISEYRTNPISKQIFLKALMFKMLGRITNLLELTIIFVLLGITPSIVELIVVITMITVSSSIMFIFPQGIGVHEASITGAFKMLGYSTTLGLSFGLIRRSRSIFWVVFGIILHLGYEFYTKKMPKKY